MTDREVMRLALEALEDMYCGWKYIREVHGDLYGVGWDRAQGKAEDAIEALRQALDHVPDTTKMIEPDMGIDRGAWDDVPDATKWVDELRGDEPWYTSDMAYRPNGLNMEQEPVTWRNAAIRLGEDLYSVGPNGYYDMTESQWLDWALSVVNTARPKREWVGLTDEEIDLACIPLGAAMLSFTEVARAIEAKLKEKNRG